MQSSSLFIRTIVGFPTSQTRSISYPRWWYNVRTSMRKRKEHLERAQKAPLHRPRSIFPNWNYRAELFAFGKRLNEDLPETILQRTFIHHSYIEKEKSDREKLGESDEYTGLSLEDNSSLVLEGEKVMCDFIQKYLHMAYPALPKEGKNKIQDYLMAEDLLAHVGSHIGIPDLILSVEFPASKTAISHTFLALVGALKVHGNVQRAENFVQDFIVTELIGKDILEIWNIPHPVGYLRNLLADSNKELEFRMLKETGRNTIFAVYLVGVYVDKRLIGKGPGETISIAEEIASIDALKKIFGLQEHAKPLDYRSGVETTISPFTVEHCTN